MSEAAPATQSPTLARDLPKLDDVLSAGLKVTGSDIPPGSYPGTLCAFGDPFLLDIAEQFRKPGRPTKRAVMEATFCTFDKNGVLSLLDYLIPVPMGGAANRKSNVYKLLRSLGTGDDKLLAGDGFASGVSLKSFVGKTAILSVKLNKKEFPQIDGTLPPMAGLKYPTLDECNVALAAATPDVSDEGNIPF